jgi:GNAT superfamily N-acetyltransferase
MNTHEGSSVSFAGLGLSQPAAAPRVLLVHSEFLQLVTRLELEDLRRALTFNRGELPPDLETKLDKLAGQGLGSQILEHNCRWFAALWIAARQGLFRHSTPEQTEKLLRVLAYVRKDEDAIPDYSPGGFTDDQHEVQAVAAELQNLVCAFKQWRLRHQVPALWKG